MGEFTKGPWFYRPTKYCGWGCVRAAPDTTSDIGRIICNVSVSHVGQDVMAEYRRRCFEHGEKCDPVEEDARLIAAAPDMYKALKDLVKDYQERLSVYFDDPTRIQDIMVLRNAKAALNKANPNGERDDT